MVCGVACFPSPAQSPLQTLLFFHIPPIGGSPDIGAHCSSHDNEDAPNLLACSLSMRLWRLGVLNRSRRDLVRPLIVYIRLRQTTIVSWSCFVQLDWHYYLCFENLFGNEFCFLQRGCG